MNLERILCVVKRPELDWYTQNPHMVSELEHKRVIDPQWWARMNASYDNQQSFLDAFQQRGRVLGLPVSYVQDTQLGTLFERPDIVISVGGDGTLVRVIEHFPDVPVLGVNNDYSTVRGQGSVGATLVLDTRNYASGLEDLASGKFEMRTWRRLSAMMNGELLGNAQGHHYATNEIIVRNPTGGTTGGTLIIGDIHKEFGGSSGPLFCTGVGSTAHHRNAGGSTFAPDASLIGYVVRENNEDHNPRIAGILTEGTRLEFMPEREGYSVYFDAKHVCVMSLCDTLSIQLSTNGSTQAIIPYCCRTP